MSCSLECYAATANRRWAPIGSRAAELRALAFTVFRMNSTRTSTSSAWQGIARRLLKAAVCFGAAPLLSCGAVTSPVDDLGPVPNGAFTTDATGYVAARIPGEDRYRFTVISRFQNRGSATLYLGRCFPDSPQPLFSADLAAPGAQESAYSSFFSCVGHDQQFAIPPGAVRFDTLQVAGPNAFDGRTHAPIGVTSGDFRLFFDVRLAPGDGAPSAPDSLQRSNAFRVRTSG